MTKILYTSSGVRKAIADIFRAKGKRIAISAFVGEGAEAFLPNAKGIRLVCWPKAGGTHPDALRKLKGMGVNVQFADNLHMKVYWSKKGAVVTSANLSTNALGSGRLKEFGVLLPADEIDIDGVLGSLSIRPYTNKELKQLDRKTARIVRVFGHNTKPPNYLEWYKLPPPREWKLGWYATSRDYSQAAKAMARDEFDRKTPHDEIDGKRGSYKDGDHILCFFWGSAKRCPKDFRWICADRVVKTSRRDKTYNSSNPCEAVQVFSPRHYSPPFIIDRKFKKALERAVRGIGYRNMENRTSCKPPADLLKRIAKFYGRCA